VPPSMDASCAALAPIFQVHPTRRCNLSCLHCYSNSSPRERDSLGSGFICEAISGARQQGYEVASFSGGEPVLYRDLDVLLRHAKSLGMRTTVTSNGTLLNEARLERLAGYTDVLAISLDGVPQSHDRMRDCPGAFDRMAANLEAVRAAGIDFGFIFTLTLHNVDEVAWAARFAVAQGAKLFQIHPLEEVGRAANVLAGARPDALESAYAYLEAEKVRMAFHGRLFVQVDLFHRELVARFPKRFYAEDDWAPATNLAACVTPLVMEADGRLSPMGYDFGHRYAIGNLRNHSMRELAKTWIAEVYPEFRALCRRVYAEACRPSALPFINWHEMLQAASVDALVAAD
jgi:MoaA/NifB/PqqE/SkfB family radical SAM enzyme